MNLADLIRDRNWDRFVAGYVDDDGGWEDIERANLWLIHVDKITYDSPSMLCGVAEDGNQFEIKPFVIFGRA